MADDAINWGTITALVGVGVNLIFNTVNYVANKNTRRRAVALEHFSSNVRTPITGALDALLAVMDEADDIVISPQSHDEKLAAVVELARKFHGARRKLARLLTDCDASVIIAGDDWSRIDEGHTDDATEAFENASKAEDILNLRDNLLAVARSIDALRSSLMAKLDDEASKLMN